MGIASGRPNTRLPLGSVNSGIALPGPTPPIASCSWSSPSRPRTDTCRRGRDAFVPSHAAGADPGVRRRRAPSKVCRHRYHAARLPMSVTHSQRLTKMPNVPAAITLCRSRRSLTRRNTYFSISVATWITVAHTATVVDASSEQFFSHTESGHDVLRPRTAGGTAGAWRADSRAIRLKIRGGNAYLRGQRLTIRPALIFDDIAFPRLTPELLQMVQEDPKWIVVLSAARPIVLLTLDEAGGTPLVDGLGTLTLAMAVAPSLHRGITVHGFEIRIRGMAPDVIAALVMGATTGMRSPSARSAIAQAIRTQLATSPAARGTSSLGNLRIAGLVGVSRQAVARRGHSRSRPQSRQCERR